MYNVKVPSLVLYLVVSWDNQLEAEFAHGTRPLQSQCLEDLAL